MKLSKGQKAGVAADWARFPAHLERSCRGLTVESQEQLAVGRRWSLQWEERTLYLEAHVSRREEFDPLSPSRIGGKRSNEIGDVLVEFDFKPDLLWQFKNVTMHLRVLTEDVPEDPTPTERALLLRVAKAAQPFLEASVVNDLDAVTPRLELPTPEDTTLVLGTPVRLACHAVNTPPEERHLEIRSEGFKDVTWLASELIATPEHVGTVQLSLQLQNTRSLLRSSFTGLSFQCLRERGQALVKVEARYLMDASLEEEPRLRIRLDTDPHSRECTKVFLMFLDEQRSVALQFGGPRYSNAPPNISMRLQKALLLDEARAPVPLTPSELHLDTHCFPELRGTITLGSQDWELTAVSAGALSDASWAEELRRRGLDVAPALRTP
jgi:hypothetical protein